MKFRRWHVFAFLSAVSLSAATPVLAGDCVILLHGLARTSSSMANIETAFARCGYTVANIDYPSRKRRIEELAPLAVAAGMAQCKSADFVHFVTHSMGGILVRYYLQNSTLPNLGRVVMLAPPNKGSEVVDNLRDLPGFRLINGPAGLQLGTDDASIVHRLGAVSYELGVIAGTKTFNPILSQYLPNPDDGKVSVESTKIEGMSDFITVDHSHPFIMKSPRVIEQTLAFIETGRFVHDASNQALNPRLERCAAALTHRVPTVKPG